MLMDFLRGADRARDLRKALGTVPGLPAAPTQKKPQLASTRTNLVSPFQETAASGMPSVKLVRLQGGGVAVEVRRKTRFAALLDEGDLTGLKRLAGQMVERAENQSQGGLSTRELRRRGHPYGRGPTPAGRKRGGIGRIGQARGVRGSVPSLAIVNRQSGEFSRSWSADVSYDENGVVVRLVNDAPTAGFLAFGTQRMKAHSPATNVVAAFQSQLNSEWQRVVYRATRRKQLEQEAALSLGLI